MADRKRNLPAYRMLVERFFTDEVKGKANPYTSLNGNMYSFLDDQSRVCLRLSEEDRARYAAEFRTAPVEQYGAVMKGYVAVPEDALAAPDNLADLYAASLAFARGLPKK